MTESDATREEASDLLVIGGGFAGLWAAITAREQGVKRVTIVDKGAVGLSSQSRMSAGATICLFPEDDRDLWLRHIAEANDFLSHQGCVAAMLDASYWRYCRLRSWGVRYERLPWALSDRGSRLRSRGLGPVLMMVNPSWGGCTGGGAVVRALLERATRLAVRRVHKVMVTDLIVQDGRVAGAVGFDRLTGRGRVFAANAVVLAAADCSFRGGYACVAQATGDAFRMAYSAGARLANMEFLVINTGSPHFGFEGTGIAARWGGKFVDENGRAVASGRDEVRYVARDMVRARERGARAIFFDMSRPPAKWILRGVLGARMGGWMPLHVRRLAAVGTDLFAAPQPWLPVIQTLRGGVWTDAGGRSDVDGLFAAGLSRALDPGLFNGWSSLYAMWSGEVAGRAAAGFLGSSPEGTAVPSETHRAARDGLAASRRFLQPRPNPVAFTADEAVHQLQRALFPHDVCLAKTGPRLRAALARVESIDRSAALNLWAATPHELAKCHEAINMLLTARLFLSASLVREETRCDHWRLDYPARNDQRWLRWILLSRGAGDCPVVSTEPVPVHLFSHRPDAVESSVDRTH
ncbi:MAG: FAD-binding protein [Candidatus Schekmanbacteria bacterium]|nr:FAD-binding protein [Candidatus Schekmanbacteria bacterium]